MKGGIGVPKVYWFGSKDDFNILIMELLGPSLQDFLKYCWGRFSLKTVLMLAKQARMIKFTPKISGKKQKNFIKCMCRVNSNSFTALNLKQHQNER